MVNKSFDPCQRHARKDLPFTAKAGCKVFFSEGVFQICWVWLSEEKRSYHSYLHTTVYSRFYFWIVKQEPAWFRRETQQSCLFVSLMPKTTTEKTSCRQVLVNSCWRSGKTPKKLLFRRSPQIYQLRCLETNPRHA